MADQKPNQSGPPHQSGFSMGGQNVTRTQQASGFHLGPQPASQNAQSNVDGSRQQSSDGLGQQQAAPPVESIPEGQLRAYSRLIGRNWELTAYELGFTEHQVDCLRDRYPNRMEPLLYTMVKKWHDTVVSCGEDARQLLAACFASEENNVAAEKVIGEGKLAGLKGGTGIRAARTTKIAIQQISFDVTSTPPTRVNLGGQGAFNVFPGSDVRLGEGGIITISSSSNITSGFSNITYPSPDMMSGNEINIGGKDSTNLYGSKFTTGPRAHIKIGDAPPQPVCSNEPVRENGSENVIKIPPKEVLSSKPEVCSQMISHLQSPWVQRHFDMNPIFLKMPEMKMYAEGGKRLNPDTRRQFVREVVSEVRKVSTNCGKKEFQSISQMIVKRYPNTFEDRIGEVCIGTGYDSLLKQLISRNENLNRSSSPHQAAKMGAADTSAKAAKKRPAADCDAYGCVSWGPTLTEEEEKEQEKTRMELMEMYKSMNRDTTKINDKMISSYGLLRKMINDGESINELVAKWPFLTQASVLLQHCEHLVEHDVMAKIEQAYLHKGPVLLKYFKSKQGMSRFLEKLQSEQGNDNLQAVLLGTILCLQKCLGEEMNSLMFPVDEMASNDEIQHENKESWPRLAMLGETQLAARDFALVLDGQVIARSSSFLEALSLLFASYFIFNIKYPDQASATLEFIQRSFVGIDPNKGGKSGKKRRSSSVNSKVLNLINEIDDFQWIS